jgi:N-carbamoylputrescine amidase
MKLSLAAVQMESKNRDYEGNRKRAEGYILEAVENGAKLISLPEFALIGYLYEDSIWNEAEPLRGRTYQWLNELCNKYKVYIATCILEKDKKDFFDTFILCGPDDRLWFHRKIEPASYEAFYFKGAGVNPNTFNTPIGKIGIAICFDTSKTYSIKSLIKNRPDLVLLLFSYPSLPSFSLKRDINNWVEIHKNIPTIYAKCLKVPVVSCNKTGKFSTSLPLSFGIKYKSDFVDYSAIVDSNGNVVSVISNRPGVICTEVELGNENYVPENIISEGRWYLPYTFFTRFTTEYTQKIGKIRYKFSRKRKKAALLY